MKELNRPEKGAPGNVRGPLFVQNVLPERGKMVQEPPLFRRERLRAFLIRAQNRSARRREVRRPFPLARGLHAGGAAVGEASQALEVKSLGVDGDRGPVLAKENPHDATSSMEESLRIFRRGRAVIIPSSFSWTKAIFPAISARNSSSERSARGCTAPRIDRQRSTCSAKFASLLMLSCSKSARNSLKFPISESRKTFFSPESRSTR